MPGDLSAERNARRKIAAGLLGCSLICAGCGGAAPSSIATASPSAAATGAASTSPSSPATGPSPSITSSPAAPVFAEVDAPKGFVSKITCSGSIGATDPVAIVVTDENSREIIMRDYADITNPRTVCAFPDERVRLLDARHVVFEGCGTDAPCALAVVDLPEVRYHWYELPTTPDGPVNLVAVAPDLATAAWTESKDDGDGALRTLVLRDATGDHLIADLERYDFGDCGPEPRTEAAFARTGSYLYVIDTYIGSHLYVIGGHDVEQSLESVGSAVWSPTSSTLYFRKGHHVYRWAPDVGTMLLERDLEWTNPTLSPDGMSLAYAAPNGNAGHDIYLADPAHLDQARRIAANASLPVFLNNERLWFKNDEGPLGCGPGEPPRERVYNLPTSTTASTVITEVLSVWPATR
jgi:hypothetical protein